MKKVFGSAWLRACSFSVSGFSSTSATCQMLGIQVRLVSAWWFKVPGFGTLTTSCNPESLRKPN